MFSFPRFKLIRFSSAHLFNLHLHSVFCKESSGVPLLPVHADLQQDPNIDDCTNYVTCDTKEGRKILKYLNANKSSAVDKIPARLLKETANMSAVPLCKLFTLSFELGRFIPSCGNMPTSYTYS
jgi:hypothetical protein